MSFRANCRLVERPSSPRTGRVDAVACSVEEIDFARQSVDLDRVADPESSIGMRPELDQLAAAPIVIRDIHVLVGAERLYCVDTALAPERQPTRPDSQSLRSHT